MKAQTPFSPGATLTIDADRRFMLVSQTDGAGRQGRLGVMGPQLMMLADDGSVEVHLYEAPTNDHLVFTSMTDGFKYDLNRRR
jgi:hypothetical protein